MTMVPSTWMKPDGLEVVLLQLVVFRTGSCTSPGQPDCCIVHCQFC